MFLAIDIGNTNITVGLFQGNRLHRFWRMSSLSEKTSDEHRVLLRELFASAKVPPAKVTRAIMASVVPKATTLLMETLSQLSPKTRVRLVGRDLIVPMVNRYRDPHQVGQDRLVNAYGAWRRYGVPCFVVDFGTAITFDVVSPQGEYLGGIIVPGIELSVEALSARAAMLPHIELVPPDGLIGRDTVNSMRSGAFYGFAALCDGLLRQLKEAARYRQACVILTGGQAEAIAPYLRTPHRLDPLLTLNGLLELDRGHSKKS